MSFSEWREIKLSDVVDILGDGLHGTPKYDNHGECYFINGNNLNGNIVIDDKTKKVSYEEYLKYKKNLNDRTILVSINGTIGNVALYNDEKAILGKSACYFNVKTNVDKYFVMYTLISEQFKQYSQNYATGTTIKNLGLKQIREFQFVLPPLSEQKAIAATLFCLDDKIELNSRINKTLEEMAQTIFKSWFVDFEPFQDGEFEDSELGRIPKGWRVESLTKIVEVCGGGTPKTNVSAYWNGVIPFFTPKDCTSGYYAMDTEKYITIDGLQHCNSKLYSKDTVFVTARGTVGKVNMAICDMAMNQSCYALKGFDGYSQFFIHQLTINLIDKLKHKASGAVFDAIITRDFNSEFVCIPSKISLNLYNESIKPLYSLIEQNQIENKMLVITRDSLLPKLMSGEIRVPLSS